MQLFRAVQHQDWLLRKIAYEIATERFGLSGSYDEVSLLVEKFVEFHQVLVWKQRKAQAEIVGESFKPTGLGK